MFVVLVEWRVAPENAARFAGLLAEQATRSLATEAECHTFDVCHDPEDPSTFTLYEVYTDAAAFDVHLASDHMAAFSAQADPMTVTKTVFRLERLSDGRPPAC